MSGLLAELVGGAPASRLQRPAFAVDFGGAADAWAASLITATVASGLAPSVGVAELVAAADAAPAVAVGDTGRVSLGYGDDPKPVFTGHVHAVQRTVRGELRVLAADAGAKLAALRVNQSYDSRSAGDVVEDLARQAGANAANVAGGIKLPFYVVDDRRTGYQHLAALAAMSGCVAFVTPEGEITVKPVAQQAPAQTFAFASDVLSFELVESAPLAGEVTAVGEGAAGSNGTDAWSWPAKERSSVEGKAGKGEPSRLLPNAALRSVDAAKSAAGGRAGAAALAAATGRLVVGGTAAVAVGATVAVTGAAALDGTYFVRQVRHGFSKRGGFTTELAVSKLGAGGPGALVGAIGGLL